MTVEDDSGSQHLITIDRIVNALANPLPNDQGMFDISSEGSEELGEPDVDMLLSHFHNEAKLEALARRGPSKSGSHSKKGRNSFSS